MAFGETNPKPSFSPWRKWSIGLNVLLIILVVFSVVVMVNYLSRDYFTRFHWSTTSKHTLSPLTLNLLHSLTNKVRVVIYYDKNDPFWGQKLIEKVAENILSALQNQTDAVLLKAPK